MRVRERKINRGEKKELREMVREWDRLVDR